MWLWCTWQNCHFITLSGGLWQGPNFVRWSKFWLKLLYLVYMWQIILSSSSFVTCDRQIVQYKYFICDVKAIKIIVTQMEVQNLRINSVFVLFMSDKSIENVIENVSTYHKKCEDSAYCTILIYLVVMCHNLTKTEMWLMSQVTKGSTRCLFHHRCLI